MARDKMGLRIFVLAGVVVLSAAVLVAPASAGPINIDDRLAGGVVINEVLADPSAGADGCGTGFSGVDVNEDGCFNQADEFIELYNGLDEAIEMPNWSLWTNDGELVFTFPEEAEIEAYGYVVITADWDSTMSNEFSTINGADLYSADRPEGMLLDAGDNIVLLDPDFEEYIQAYYSGANSGQTEPIDNPLNEYDGFVDVGDQIGEVSNFGLAGEGVSQVRLFSADEEILAHIDVDGEAASPGDHYTAVTLRQMVAHTTSSSEPFFIVTILSLTLTTFCAYRRWVVNNSKINRQRGTR